jgi:acetyltransferase-like isoleucine patch superfamily enzyme
MQKQPSFALLRHSVRTFISSARRYYLQLAGLQVAAGGSLGKISCKWPKNVKIGAECVIEDRVRFHIASPFSADNYIKLGDRVFIGECSQLNCVTSITVGNDTMIAANTTIVDVSHEVNPALPINKQPTFGKEIVIGNDVWIGAGAIILKGVTIGDGSVIGAGSLVNKSIPPYQMWAGSPARFIRNRD